METFETRFLCCADFCLLAAEATYSKPIPKHRGLNEDGLSKCEGSV